MILTPSNVFHYLCDIGFSSAQEVVNRDFCVYNMSRRNTALKVCCRSRPDYIVKQGVGGVKGEPRSAEVKFYRMALHHPDCGPLQAFMPNCRRCDETNQIVILELPHTYEDLNQHFVRVGRVSLQVAQLLGETLAAFHYVISPAKLEEVRDQLKIPPPTSLYWFYFPVEDEESAARRDLRGYIHEHPIFQKTFERLIDSWRPETLVNGEIKFVHCILAPSHIRSPTRQRQFNRENRLHFIDWETAGIGDPCCDVGAVFHEYLSCWIGSIPVVPGVSYEESSDKAEYPLEDIHSAIRAFWTSYCETAEIAGAEAGYLLDRSLECAAAWLLQTAYQYLPEATTISEPALRLSRLSLKLLEHVPEERRSLVGL